MRYKDIYSQSIVKKFSKIKKKDPKHLSIVFKKINEIVNNPENIYKFLKHNMKGINRVHIGHFVLVFRIMHDKEIVSFEDYDHHDKIYQ